MSHALGIYRLQQADSRIDQTNQRLQEIRAVLENNSLVQAVRSRLEASEAALKEAEKGLRQSEATAQAQRIKIEQVESSLYGGRVQNPKELRDLQSELTALKRHLASLEDKQLEAMILLETTREQQQTTLKELRQAEAQVISQNSSLKSEQDTLLSNLENLKAERAAIQNAISADILQKYELLRQKKHGLAVTTVSEGACDACGAGLTPAQAQIARISTQLFECPTCGRILFSN
jgi:predicted  nucleic acid-binding Zn-ribbon protein